MRFIYSSPTFHGENIFFINGLKHLFSSILKEFKDKDNDESFVSMGGPDVWVFSHEGVSELYSFIRQVKHHRLCFVFGNDNHKRVLHQVPGLEKVIFFNVRLPALLIRRRIKKIIRIMIMGGRSDTHMYHHPPDLTLYERYVLVRLISEFSISEIADASGKPVKSVSACKRRIMKKYNVFNNQELYVRAFAMGLRPIAKSSKS